MQIRPALLVDADAIAEIYNEGIEDRVATFETRLRSAEDIASWFDGVHPIMLAEEEEQAIAFAATSTYRPRECYEGIAEVSVYVARHARRRGAGTLVLQAIITACEKKGFWKLVSRVFPENMASRRLIGSLGLRCRRCAVLAFRQRLSLSFRGMNGIKHSVENAATRDRKRDKRLPEHRLAFIGIRTATSEIEANTHGVKKGTLFDDESYIVRQGTEPNLLIAKAAGLEAFIPNGDATF